MGTIDPSAIVAQTQEVYKAANSEQPALFCRRDRIHRGEAGP
jgi:hypothetical protein